MTGNFFLWLETSFCGRKYLRVTGKLFCDMKLSNTKFLSGWGSSFFWTEISAIFHTFHVQFQAWFLSYIKILTKLRDFCSKFCLRIQGFLARFLPSYLLKSHHGWHSVRSHGNDFIFCVERMPQCTRRLKKETGFSCITKIVVTSNPCNRFIGCFFLLKHEINL